MRLALALTMVTLSALGCGGKGGQARAAADPCAGVTCTAADQCHAAGTCDPATGRCSSPARPDGTACDDQDPCTRGDACQAGACTGLPLCPSLAAATARLAFGGACVTSAPASGQRSTCFASGARLETRALADRLEVRLFEPGGSGTPALLGLFTRTSSSFVDGATGAPLLSVASAAPGLVQVTCDGQTLSLTPAELAACGPAASAAVPACAAGACP